MKYSQLFYDDWYWTDSYLSSILSAQHMQSQYQHRFYALGSRINNRDFPAFFQLLNTPQMNQYFQEFKVIIITQHNSKNVMSWYNTYSENTKKLQLLIENKPTLQQLLEFPEFMETLKAYQPKVLEYITNSFQVPKEMVKYLTQAPKESDSDSRKYKLPLLTVMMIETNTTCVINSFLKIDPRTQKPYFIEAFNSFLCKEEHLLPLLCGYFSQMNVVLWNNRYRQVIDMVYDSKTPLLLLAKHTYNKALVNTLLLYLNLDMTRNPIIQPERTQLKLQILKSLYLQIKVSYEKSQKMDQSKGDMNEIIIQNICEVLIEIVEKYYLISDGKAMLDFITTQQNVELVLQILMSHKNISFSVVGLVLILMRYYCLSSFNQEDLSNVELSKKNQERLESQPFVKRITELIPKVSSQLGGTSKFTLYHSKLLEAFIPVIELSSHKIAKIVKSTKFLQNILDLLFKWPHLSIVHKQVQRAFFAVFCSQRRVCEQYRKYLFCEALIIQRTAGECLKRCDSIGEKSIRLGWFSFLMKIVKVYSKIQTNDEEINQAIMHRAALWEKFSANLMRPWDGISFKDLGSYEGLPERAPVQYTVKTMGAGLQMMNATTKKVIEELIKEESMNQFLTTIPDKPQENKAPAMNEDALFVVQDFQKPLQGSPKKQQKPTLNQVVVVEQPHHSSNLLTVPDSTVTMNSPKESSEGEEKKKEEEASSKNFNDFMSSKSKEIENQITMQRKNSRQKRLSANKSRLASPSPSKRKKWDQTSQDEEPSKPSGPGPKIPSHQPKKQRISLTTSSVTRPSIPMAKSPRAQTEHEQVRHSNHLMTSPKPQHDQKKEQGAAVVSISNLNDERITKSISFDGHSNLSQSMSVNSLDLSRNTVEELKDMMSKSAVNLGELKNMRIKRQKIQGRFNKSGRKIGKEDKLLLDFLGYPY